MASDRYLKAVLTVIAACLVYICIALTTGPAVSAQRGPEEVIIVGWKPIDSPSGYVRMPGAGRASAAPLPVDDVTQ